MQGGPCQLSVTGQLSLGDIVPTCSESQGPDLSGPVTATTEWCDPGSQLLAYQAGTQPLSPVAVRGPREA